MKFISLFSGIGGIDLGLERAGMECVAQVEFDPFCQQVLKKHWPNVPLFGDIKEVDSAALPYADLICGGFPCQPVSAAGNKRAQDDDRWLWPQFARLIREVRPLYALLENVPGLLTTSSGRAAQEVFGDLAELGFDAEWEVLSARAFGAAHLRKRVIIVAHRPSSGLEGRIFSPTTRGALPILASSHRWAARDDLARAVHGFPGWVDRHKSLGNAVVPQVAEYVGRKILEFDRD